MQRIVEEIYKPPKPVIERKPIQVSTRYEFIYVERRSIVVLIDKTRLVHKNGVLEDPIIAIYRLPFTQFRRDTPQSPWKTLPPGL